MRYYTHRNDDRPARKLLPFARNKICHEAVFVNGGQTGLYTLLRQRLRIGREDHPGLATNFAGQFGGDPAHRQARVIHILCLHQPRKGLRLIQHGINVLGLRQVLGFTAARHKRQLLTFGDFFDH